MSTKTNNSSVQSSTVQQKHTQNVVSGNLGKQSEAVSITQKTSMSVDGPARSQQVTSSLSSTSSSNVKTMSTKVSQSATSQSASSKASPKLPGLRGSISIRKLIKNKLLDREILQKLEMGLTTLEEVQASLAQFIGKPTAIAGIYMESSKTKMTFMEAAEKGLLAKTYAIEFMEAQAATGCVTDPSTGVSHSVQEALEKGLVEPDVKDKLLDAEKAVSGYIHGGKPLSVFQAMEERILDRHKGKKILEAQVATGGLVNPVIGVRVPANIALEQGLINKAALQSLFDPVSNPRSFHNPDSGQKAYYSELLKVCLYDIDGGVYLLPFGERHLSGLSPASSHRVSVISSSAGVEMSTFEAFKTNCIDRRTYLFLSQQDGEWQEKSTVDVNGSPLHIIIDLKSGRQVCIETALSQRFLETTELVSYRSGLISIYQLVDLIFSRMVVVEDPNSPIAGVWDGTQKRRLSVLQALQQNLVDRLTALRFLEAQACTGGICDPASGERSPIPEALRRGLLDESFARQLLPYEQAYDGIIHPHTAKILSVSQAVQENLFPKDVGLRCLEYQLLTGGLPHPETHERVSLEEAIHSCLVDKATAAIVKDDKSHSKTLTCPKTRRKISFKEALERGVPDCHTGMKLLEATRSHSVGAKPSFQYIWTYRPI